MTDAEEELTKRAIVAISETLSHLRKPPILSKNNATDIFTKQMTNVHKSNETNISFRARMTCARSK